MAGRSARGRRTSHDGSPLMLRTPDRPRRSLSNTDDAAAETPRATAHGANLSPTRDGFFHSADHPHQPPSHPPHAAAKRLGFLGDKLLAATAVASSPAAALARGHARAESATAPTTARDMAPSPAPSLAPAAVHHAKGHPSPSKLVSREMHRLGTLAHLPVLNSSASVPSGVTLVGGSTASLSSAPGTGDQPWTALHIYILPLFNGEGLRVPIEDLNALVKRHIHSVVSASPSKAMATLEHDAAELITGGIVTLSAKLELVEDEHLVHQVVKTWEFFWDDVLPYVEGALLPLQTDSLLSSLYRNPKVHKPASSPVGQDGSSPILPPPKIAHLDVRTIALRHFRDGIVQPLAPILHDRLTALKERYPQSAGYPPRLQQMLLVLLSQRALPTLYSLTAPPPTPAAGEEAVQLLLRAIRTPLVQLTRPVPQTTAPPSFLSAGAPRDRRGRVARKPEGDAADAGEETPRLGGGFGGRGRERALLESLRSPDPEGVRGSMGGWGLGLGSEEKPREEDEEEDENLDWDQAQAVVERMVGMRSAL